MSQSKAGLTRWYIVTILSLGAAYWASLPSREPRGGSLTVASLDRSRIKSLKVTSKALTVEASVNEKGRWWITTSRTAPANPAGGGAATAVGGENQTFAASAKFGDILSGFSPMAAVRELGVLSGDKLKDFGFGPDNRSVQVNAADGQTLLDLKIGGGLYGSRSAYVMNLSDQKVWLVSGEWLSDLEKPEANYFERSLTTPDAGEVTGAEVRVGDRFRRFEHTRRDEKGAILWVAAGEDKADSAASVWFSRFEQLKAALYADAEQAHHLATLPPLFTVKMFTTQNSEEALTFLKKTSDGQAEYWVFSGYLGAYVKVATTRAESLERDVAALVGKP
jgi:hypothetical protein